MLTGGRASSGRGGSRRRGRGRNRFGAETSFFSLERLFALGNLARKLSCFSSGRLPGLGFAEPDSQPGSNHRITGWALNILFLGGRHSRILDGETALANGFELGLQPSYPHVERHARGGCRHFVDKLTAGFYRPNS